ncbi:MAG: PorT family protein [Bacteroidales bacterium]|nr:PorT family protein [Bacteroidales bacterium]
MKKFKFILMIAAFVFGFSAMAQFTYGPKVGLNLANVSGDDVDNNKMLIGFNAGLLGNYAFGDMFSVQVEAMYDAKGAKYEGTDENGNDKTYPFSLGYISIPIMAKATFGDDIKFFGEIGPTIGLLMSAKMDGESEYEVPTGFNPQTGQFTYETIKVKDSYKSTDIGLVFGVGTLLPAGNMKVMIDARYNMGLGTIAEKPDEGDAADIKNGVISINVGLIFGGE